MKFVNKKTIFSLFLLSTCMILSSCGPKPTESFTIIWKNDDGSVLKEEKVNSGELPRYDGTPSKEGDEQYKYTFSHWEPEVVAATKDATYTAIYTFEIKSYKVSWLNNDGTVLKEDDVKYGEMPTYTGETPTKKATDQFSYTFSNWSPTLVPVTGNVSYVAQYSTSVNSYKITWLDDNGSTLRVDTLQYNSTPFYGANPTKQSDQQFDYTFSHWDPEITKVTQDATYKATYSSSIRSYAITWKMDDDTTLRTDQVEYGRIPDYGSKPTKPSTGSRIHVFSGWSPEITAVTGPKTYVAQFVDYDYGGQLSVTFPKDASSYKVEFKYSGTLPQVDWGDGTVDTNSTHTYATIPNTYSITFTSISGLSSFSLSDYYGVYASGNQYISEVVLCGVTSIGDYAFRYCSSLTSINILNSVTSIGDCAFQGCSSLTSINIPNSVTSIGSFAFYDCSSLTSINIPNSVTSIGDSTFLYCSSLTSIYIPNSVTSIGESIFSDCSSMTDIYCEADSKPSGWDDDWLGNIKDKVRLHWGAMPPNQNG